MEESEDFNMRKYDDFNCGLQHCKKWHKINLKWKLWPWMSQCLCNLVNTTFWLNGFISIIYILAKPRYQGGSVSAHSQRSDWLRQCWSSVSVRPRILDRFLCHIPPSFCMNGIGLRCQSLYGNLLAHADDPCKFEVTLVKFEKYRCDRALNVLNIVETEFHNFLLKTMNLSSS